MLSTLISKVYVINLEKSIERKTHITHEFKRLQIKNYEIFKATDKDSLKVKKMMKTDYVKKFPPCFRCHKNVCLCSNNVLIKHQVGNWCSFIEVMKEIEKQDISGLIMICEDDIKFTDNGLNIFNNLMEKLKFQDELPILVRAGSGYSNLHTMACKPKFASTIIMSNPCFIINKYFARSFLNNLKQINTTSDLYIHRYLPSLDKSIQTFTMIPQPIYELSCRKFKKFPSEIHPKGRDLIYNKTHIKRIEYKTFLCVGHPRCGTNSIAHYLQQMGHDVGHENMKSAGVSSWMLAVEDSSYPWGNVTNKSQYYFKHIIHVIRNPFHAIPSIILENKYSPFNKSFLFKRKHIKRILNIDLPLVDFNNCDFKTEFKVAIQCYLYWNRICERLKPGTICRIEDISSLSKFNLYNRHIEADRKNSNKLYNGKKYLKPVVTPEMFESLEPKIKGELQCFCEKYQYDIKSSFNQRIKTDDVFNIHNFKMYIPPSNTDGIFMTLRNTQTWEPNVTQALLRKADDKNIDTFIDIGANIGYYSLLFANRNIQTYSFEPNPENYEILAKNVDFNQNHNCMLHNIGLSNCSSVLEFFYRKEKSGHGTFNKNISKMQKLNLCKKIQVEKLDDMDIKGNNIMLKIDIEGYELNAIQGMTVLLQSGRLKVFCIEISRTFYGPNVENQILDILKKYYTKFYIVQLKQQLVQKPKIQQYDLICS